MKNSFIKSAFAFVAIVAVASTAFTNVYGYGDIETPTPTSTPSTSHRHHTTTGTKVKETEKKEGEDKSKTPKVLGASTSTIPAFTCDGMYIKSYMRMGKNNDAGDVLKLQVFLNAKGMTTPTDGIFGTSTDAAVRKFQVDYMSDILAPWKINTGTGYVYKTTRAKINNMVCPGSEPTPKI